LKGLALPTLLAGLNFSSNLSETAQNAGVPTFIENGITATLTPDGSHPEFLSSLNRHKCRLSCYK
jgi:hypothetical protein